MRRLKCTKLLLGLITLFAIFGINLIGSNNVHALDLVVNSKVKDVLTVDSWRCQYTIESVSNWQYSNCPVSISSRLEKSFFSSFTSTNTFDITEGNYYEVTFSILSNVFNSLTPQFWTFQNNDDFDFVSVRELISQSPPVTESLTGGSVSSQSVFNGYNYTVNILVRAKSSGTKSIKIGKDNTSNLILLNDAFNAAFTNVYILYPYLSVTEYELDDAASKLNEKDDQDRNDMESVSEKSDSDAESSSAQAESTGTTLLAAFSSFVTALTNASPTSCKINMDMGNLNLGNVDFCTLSPPPAFQTIASILLIAFCVPLSIATARKVISLFRSFQS